MEINQYKNDVILTKAVNFATQPQIRAFHSNFPLSENLNNFSTISGAHRSVQKIRFRLDLPETRAHPLAIETEMTDLRWQLGQPVA